MVKYLNLMLCLTLIDLVLTLIENINLPFATMVGTVIVCVIELKSIIEKHDQKEKVRDAAKTLSVIVQNPTDFVRILEEFDKSKINETKENTNQKTEKL